MGKGVMIRRESKPTVEGGAGHRQAGKGTKRYQRHGKREREREERNCQSTSIRLQGAISQKAVVFKVTTMKT
jgi:hypothetical protein